MNLERRNKVLQTHLLRERLSLDNIDYRQACLGYFDLQRKLDLPKGQKDITSQLVLRDKTKIMRAELIVKEDGMLAGLEEVLWYLKQQSQLQNVFSDCGDAEFVRHGRRILFLEGEAAFLLEIERHVVNFLQRMSGIATQAYDIIGAAASYNHYVLICPTRKTHFGPLDKKAVTIAGGGSHRVYLSDAILVKENHFAASGGSFEEALHGLSKHKENLAFIEVEVETPDQALRAAKILVEMRRKKASHVPCGLLLDNFNSNQIRQTLAQINESGLYEDLFFEASGGINKNSLQEYVTSGVDIISMGMLTNQSPTLDISMDIIHASSQ